MTDPVIVYAGPYPTAYPLLDHLAERGLDAFALERPSSDALHHSKGTYRIRLAVPGEQAAEAQELVRRYLFAESPRVEVLAERFRREVLFCALLLAPVLAAARLYWGAWEKVDFTLVVVGWAGLVAGMVALQRRAHGKSGGPPEGGPR